MSGPDHSTSVVLLKRSTATMWITCSCRATGGPGQPAPVPARGGSLKGLVNITTGNTDVYDLACCTAKPSYNDAAGWGSADFPQFVSAAVSAGRK